MARRDDMERRRLVTKVAWLYHTRGVKQSDVAARLGISQSRVSRLLDQAVADGIVRTVVVAPDGLHVDLEEALEQRYGLREAHVFDVEAAAAEDDLVFVDALGDLVASRLQAHPPTAEIVGLTSWSRSLQATVAALRPMSTPVGAVVEMLGDVGPMTSQHHAADTTRQLAALTGAEPHFLRIPGVLPSRETRETVLSTHPDARRALDLLDGMGMALVGIGTCEVVPPLTAGNNFFTEEQLALARRLGAVGQVNLRFIAEDGSPVSSELDDLVVGVTLEQLRRTERVLAVAGGPAKYPAIRGALLGGWVNSLVTDRATARWLLS